MTGDGRPGHSRSHARTEYVCSALPEAHFFGNFLVADGAMGAASSVACDGTARPACGRCRHRARASPVSDAAAPRMVKIALPAKIPVVGVTETAGTAFQGWIFGERVRLHTDFDRLLGLGQRSSGPAGLAAE